MGRVFLAEHSFMGRKAAVKVLHPDLARNEALVARFLNEARAANAIHHANIIDIIDVGILPEDGTPFLLMEFLEGESLATRLDRTGRLNVESAIHIVSQTASALSAAHARGIVHRDLKPDNLFLVPDPLLPGGERVKVLDFGIAKLQDDLRGISEKTLSGSIMGTSTYMSPEQCQGSVERIDHRADIYALGIILFELVCGAPPFVASGFADMVIAHMLHTPPGPSKINPAVPTQLEEAILRALEKKPENRFQSMGDFQIALETIPQGNESFAPPKRLHSRPPATAILEIPVRTPSAQTTFTNSAGESADHEQITEFGRRNHTRTIIGVAIGTAVLGLTLFFLTTSGPNTTPIQTSAGKPKLAPIPLESESPPPDHQEPERKAMPVRPMPQPSAFEEKNTEFEQQIKANTLPEPVYKAEKKPKATASSRKKVDRAVSGGLQPPSPQEKTETNTDSADTERW